MCLLGVRSLGNAGDNRTHEAQAADERKNKVIDRDSPLVEQHLGLHSPRKDPVWSG